MKFYIVDCFAEAKYQGNPLAVLIPDRPVSDAEMQRIAIEIGFSETTFIMSGRQADGGYDVRIFTTSCEVPFAGHPTLGTAYVIREMLEGGRPPRVLLNLRAGQIPVDFATDGAGVMTQNQPVFGEILPRDAAVAAVSLSVDDVRDDFPVQWVSTGLEAVITPLRSVEVLERCRVNYDERQRFIDRHYACSLLYLLRADAGRQSAGKGVYGGPRLPRGSGYGQCQRRLSLLAAPARLLRRGSESSLYGESGQRDGTALAAPCRGLV